MLWCVSISYFQGQGGQNLFQMDPLPTFSLCISNPGYLLILLTTLCFLWFITPATITEEKRERRNGTEWTDWRSGMCRPLGELPWGIEHSHGATVCGLGPAVGTRDPWEHRPMPSLSLLPSIRHTTWVSSETQSATLTLFTTLLELEHPSLLTTPFSALL